jgi:hypothetical protein
MALALRFTVETLRMLSGLLIWSAHFLFIYVFTALACARRFQDLDWLGTNIVSWAVGIATVAAVGGIVAVMLPALRVLRHGHSSQGAPDFMRWMTVTFGGLGLIAIVWESLPVLLVPVCQ